MTDGRLVVYNERMADLNYTDVQRAVQEGLRNLQTDLQRLTNNLDLVERQADRIDDIELVVRDIQRNLQLMTTSMGTMRGGVVDPRISQMTNDLHELKTRFAVIEKFAQQMSDYMQAKSQEEQEDRQYRSA